MFLSHAEILYNTHYNMYINLDHDEENILMIISTVKMITHL